MNKKVLGLVMSLVVILLVGCGSNKSEESVDLKSSSKEIQEVSLSKFNESLESYLEKQRALMEKQAEGAVGDVADAESLITHAKNLVDSKEFKEWKEESKKIESLKLKKTAESDKITDFLSAFKEYNEVQETYFIELSKATDRDSYNDVNDKMSQQLSDAQDNFINLLSELE